MKSHKVKVRSAKCHCEESRYYRDDVAISKSVKNRTLPFAWLKTFLIASCVIVFVLLVPVDVFSELIGCVAEKESCAPSLPPTTCPTFDALNAAGGTMGGGCIKYFNTYLGCSCNDGKISCSGVPAGAIGWGMYAMPGDRPYVSVLLFYGDIPCNWK